MAETAGRLNATILIPAYNPDEKLLRLLPQLKEQFSRIVLVDDGSTRGQEIFAAAAGYVEKILVHERNRGKGAALKTGLRYIGGTSDVITADADGQHTCEDIVRVAIALASHRKGLVLGSRAFAGRVPLRSRFGNVWTRYFFFLMTGLMVRQSPVCTVTEVPPSKMLQPGVMSFQVTLGVISFARWLILPVPPP